MRFSRSVAKGEDSEQPDVPDGIEGVLRPRILGPVAWFAAAERACSSGFRTATEHRVGRGPATCPWWISIRIRRSAKGAGTTSPGAHLTDARVRRSLERAPPLGLIGSSPCDDGRIGTGDAFARANTRPSNRSCATLISLRLGAFASYRQSKLGRSRMATLENAWS
jgi:hypothetical protein